MTNVVFMDYVSKIRPVRFMLNDLHKKKKRIKNRLTKRNSLPTKAARTGN